MQTGKGTGSIRSRLLLVALVPVLVILPLGIRGAFQDISTWNQARSSVDAAERFSDGAPLTQAIRAEWLAAIDQSAPTSNDFSNESEAFMERSDAIAEQTATAFSEAVATTDAAIEQLSQRSAAIGQSDRSSRARTSCGSGRIKWMQRCTSPVAR